MRRFKLCKAKICGRRRYASRKRRYRCCAIPCRQRLREQLKHRARLRGGGVSQPSLLDSLKVLLETNSCDSTRNDDSWLREQLHHMLQHPPQGGLLAGVRKIIAQYEAWASSKMNIAKGKVPKSRWKTNGSSSSQPATKPASPAVVPYTGQRRWRNGVGTQPKDEAWHTVRWRPRPQAFGDPAKVKVFSDINVLSHHLDEVEARMEDVNEYHLVFHGSDLEIAQEACDMLKVVDNIHATLFVTGRANAKENGEDFEWLQQASWTRIAGHISSKLQVRAGWLLAMGYTWKPPVTKTTINLQERKHNSVVLRMTMDLRYCSDYNTSKAADAAKQWCYAQHPAAGAALQDTWNFVLEDKMIVKGMIRVTDMNIAEALVNASGAEWKGKRWFVEGMYPDTKRMAINWIPWDGQENWLEYGRRCKVEAAGQGLVRGRKQLGFKVDEEDMQFHSSRWILEGFPAMGHVDDVSICLEENGFSNIQILEKSRNRSSTAWSFMAKREDREEIVQSTIEDEEGITYDVVMTRAVRTRRHKPNIQPLRNSRKVQLNLEESWRHHDNDAGQKTEPIVVSQERESHDADEEHFELPTAMGDDSPSERERTPRRQKANTPDSFPEPPWQPGGKRCPNPGQGDCLFHVFAQALRTVEKDKVRSHRQIRQFAVAAMKKKQAHFEKQWDHTDSKGVATKMTYLQYIDAMAKPGTWAGKHEAQVLAEQLELQVLVHTSWGEIMEFNPEGSKTVCFHFDYSIGHWEFVENADADHWVRRKRAMALSPEEVDPALYGFKRLRGGVASSLHLSNFASTKHSVKRSISKKASNPSSRSLRLSAFASFPSLPAKDHTATVRTCSTTPSTNLDGRSGTKYKVDQDEILEWTCDHCGFILRKTRYMLKFFKYLHLKNKHSDKPRGASTSRQHLVHTGVQVADLPMMQRSWTCANCQKGLPAWLKYTAKRHLALKHMRQCYGRHVTMKENNTACSVKRITRQAVGSICTPKDTMRATKLHVLNQNATFGGHLWEQVRAPVASKKIPKNVIVFCRQCLRQRPHTSQTHQHQGVCQGSIRRSHSLAFFAFAWSVLRIDFPEKIPSFCQSLRLTTKEVSNLEKHARGKHKKGWRKVPALQKTAWFHDLCEEGIEPNPGPSCGFWNINGVENAWISFEHLLQFDIFALAETRASHWQSIEMQAHLQRKGYRVWFIPCHSKKNRRGTPLQVGGMLVAMKHSLPAYELQRQHNDQGDAITFDMHAYNLTFLWQRGADDNDGGLYEYLTEQLIIDENADKPHFACGDWNVTPEENPLQAMNTHLFTVNGPDGTPVPSRWDGPTRRATRCIDYLLANQPSHIELSYLDIAVSDHKCIYFSLESEVVFPKRTAFMMPTPRYLKPDHISNQQWRDALEKAWSDTAVHYSGDPNEDWANFCALAETLHQQVCDHFGVRYNLTHTRAKGSSPCFSTQGGHAKHHSKRCRFFLKRLQKTMARLRQLQQPTLPLEQRQVLQTKLVHQWPLEMPMPSEYAHAIDLLYSEIQKEKQKDRHQAISAWRSKMQKCGKEATQWLKCKSLARPSSLRVTAEDGSQRFTVNTADSLEVLSQFWKTIWHRSPQCEELDRVRHGQITRTQHAVFDQSWHLSPSLVVHIARSKTRGASGVDGWASEEVAHWPEQAWAHLLFLWHKWCANNHFPESWQHSRQVMIPKKPLHNQTLNVEHMRPICVQPVVCRIISSSMAHLARDWLLQLVTPSTHGGLKGRSLEAAILALDHAFSQGGLVVSMDMEKCFDYVQPTIALEHFRQAGLPDQWVRHLTHMWTDQKRWMQMGNETHDVPHIVDNSLPQGCAMAPMALINLLVEATADIEQLHGDEHTVFSQFIDDRCFATNNAQTAFHIIQAWGRWCQRLGLRENTSKLQIVCTHLSLKQELIGLGISAQAFQDTTKILGVDFVSNDTMTHATSVARDEVAVNILSRFDIMPIDRSCKRKLFRSITSSLLSWGKWMLTCDKKFAYDWITRTKRCIGRFATCASRDLWQMLEGHWVDPAMNSGLAALSAFARAMRYWHQHDQTFTFGQWAQRIRLFLSDFDLQLHMLSHSVSSLEGLHFDLYSVEDCKTLLHGLRESWRRRLFTSFLQHNRRDSSLLLEENIQYYEDRAAWARSRFQSGSSHARAVLVGAALSPAVYAIQRGQEVPQLCGECNCALVPTWHHLLWECAAHSVGRPPVPADALQARLGWPGGSEDDDRILSWMARMREHCFLRYGFYGHASANPV